MTDARWANGGRKQTVYWSVEYVDQCRKGKGLDKAGASASDSPARWRNGIPQGNVARDIIVARVAQMVHARKLKRRRQKRIAATQLFVRTRWGQNSERGCQALADAKGLSRAPMTLNRMSESPEIREHPGLRSPVHGFASTYYPQMDLRLPNRKFDAA